MAHISANERDKVSPIQRALIEAIRDLRQQAKRLDDQLGRIESVARELVSAEARQQKKLRDKAAELQGLIDAGKSRLDAIDGEISGIKQQGRNLADRVTALEEAATR